MDQMMRALLVLLALVLVLLLVGLLVRYFLLLQQINKLATKWTSQFGGPCDSSTAKHEAACYVYAVVKKFGLLKGLKYLDGKLTMNTTDKQAIAKMCVYECRKNPRPEPSS